MAKRAVSDAEKQKNRDNWMNRNDDQKARARARKAEKHKADQSKKGLLVKQRRPYLKGRAVATGTRGHPGVTRPDGTKAAVQFDDGRLLMGIAIY